MKYWLMALIMAILVISSCATSVQSMKNTGPLYTVDYVQGNDNSDARITLDTYGGCAAFTGRRANGTQEIQTPLKKGDRITEISAHGYGLTGYGNHGVAHVAIEAEEDWTDESQPTCVFIDTTAQGSLSPERRFIIHSDGNIEMPNLPKSDPHKPGYLWVDRNGFVRMSVN